MGEKQENTMKPPSSNSTTSATATATATAIPEASSAPREKKIPPSSNTKETLSESTMVSNSNDKSKDTSASATQKTVEAPSSSSSGLVGSVGPPSSTEPSKSVPAPGQFSSTKTSARSASSETKTKSQSRSSGISSTGTGKNKNRSSASQSSAKAIASESPLENDLIMSVMASTKVVGEKKRRNNKKRKISKSNKDSRRSDGSQDGYDDSNGPKKPGPKKGKKKKNADDGGKVKKKKKDATDGSSKLSPAQAAMNDMMRNLLAEDKYSVQGSVVDTDSSDDEDDERAIYAISGGASASKRGNFAEEEASLIHLDRSVITRAARKRLRIEGLRGVMDTTGSRKRANSVVIVEDSAESSNLLNSNVDNMNIDDASAARSGGRKKKRKKGKRAGRIETDDNIVIGNDEGPPAINSTLDNGTARDILGDEIQPTGADESSIFGQTTGSSNATWVECDKCKKWRRLRGIVDAKKLPLKWFCTMNKNDPDRAKCSAPEEEYEAPITPETLTDQRARKHLRLWVRRLQCNETYEICRVPLMTRGKRRHTTSAKDPYEWVRCCNSSCGKWRALLRPMDATSVMESARNGEWYCVLNTWDEKTASCAAPQENLPAIGCPPWVMQNEE